MAFKIFLFCVAVAAIILAMMLKLPQSSTSESGTSSNSSPTKTLDAFPDDLDGNTLSALRDAGSDLKKSCPARFYLYFPDETRARAAAKLMNPEYSLEIKEAATGTDWLILATRNIIPTHNLLHSIRDELNAIAAQHGGGYDGWEAPVMK